MVVGSRTKSVYRNVRFPIVLAAVALCTADVPTQSTPPLPYGVTDLGTLGGAASAAHDVTEYGYLSVGRAQTTSGAYHAFVDGGFGRRDLGTLGGPQSTALAASGNLVVGQAQTASGQERAFLVELGTTSVLRNLGTLGGTWSSAVDVRYGIVVGASRTTGDTRLRAFQYVDGAMSAVPFDWGGDSVARGVNSGHEIVGYACTAANARCRAFLFRGGVATDLGSLGGNSVANAINESAQIVGSSVVTGTTPHAFLYSNGAMADLGTLGGTSSEAFAINERGEVVGSSRTSSGAIRAFLWRNGVMTDLNTFLPAGSGWVLRSATSISDGGQIVGTGTHNGITRGFILTPQTDLSLFVGGVRSQSDSNLPRGIEVGKQVFWVTSLQVLDQQGITVYGATMTHTLTGPAEFVEVRPDPGSTCDLTPTVVTCRMAPVDSPSGLGPEILVRARATAPGAITHRAVVTSDVPDRNSANDSVSEANRAIALSAFALTPASLPGGKVSAAKVTLTGQAPAGDAVVRITSSRPDIAPVPATFVVPSWTNTRSFNIIPAVVSQPTTVQISATYGLVTIRKTLTVVPPTLTQLYLTPTTVIGGCGTSAGKIVLSGSAPAAGAVVPLKNTNPKANVPASVTVAAGTTSKTFTVTTQPVTSPATGTVTASYGGVSQTLNFSVRPIRVQTLTLSPNPAVGGARVSGTITLECPAAPGPVVVNLSSGNLGVARPTTPSITIPAGGRTGSFSIQTSAVPASTNVSIYATVFGVRKAATLTVTP
jgi:probable HAF family extracellular repeat protein